MHTSIFLLAAVAGLTAAEVHHPHQPRAATNTALQTTFPSASGTTNLPAAKTVAASASFDGGMKLWDRSSNTCEGQSEGGDSDAIFILEDGATLSNAIIGPNNGEGVHCMGTCTLNNVWWTDVCEDAATFKQKSGTSYVNGGGAKNAEDKVLQHNGAGTVSVKNFYAENIGKLYRSCGNCGTQYARKSTFDGIKVKTGKLVAGVNGNLGDSTSIKNACLLDTKICDLYKGVTSGEPTKTASGPDGKTCATSAIKTSGC
ncbi:hypothetical protein N0V83_004407 [Neocucurbitaria cava]|uniref:Pectate lyase n=1 Tax=Neocucurbitaria cava TaxID=798079 RepID=A0A9W9CMZ3_9PLEO|nr:hypothetical protein N0V83_004407 [Neocucurbitaria cava]